MNTTAGLNLGRVRVRDAMRQGIITADASTPLRVIARTMAEQHVHAVAITDRNGSGRPWGIITALDVVAAAATGQEPSAREVAVTEVLTVSAGERLDHAAQLMAEHQLSHLIVTDAASGVPSGVLSTLDIASAYGA
jgi:CBS domain-containing protein